LQEQVIAPSSLLGGNVLSIEDMITGIESGEVEFKQQPNTAMYKTLSAFSNTNGGIVLIGVTDSGGVVGCRCLNSDLKELSDTIVNTLGIYPGIDPFETEGKTIIRITVKKSSAPIAYEGRYYTRVGNTTRLMEGEDLREFFIQDVAWDGLFSSHDLSEIDEETIHLFLSLAIRSGRLTAVDKSEPVPVILKRLGLIIGGQLTNAAYLLFGKKQPTYTSEAVLRVGRFKNLTTITGDRWIEGNLFQQFAEGEEAIRNFINVRYEISGKTPQREEIWDYPLEAIREALINALIHRDYFKKGHQIVIKIFDDHIWMYNPGGLAKGLTIEELKASPHSVLRNPLVARVFYLAGYVEQYGSGIQRMISACADVGLPEPVFTPDTWGFSLKMRKDLLTPEYLSGLGLSERQVKAVLYVKEHGRITNSVYKNLFPDEITSKTVTRDLLFLCKHNFLARIGSTGKGTYYVLSSMNSHKEDIQDIKET
jgi:ATP-dependent DNA helicase RecG